LLVVGLESCPIPPWSNKNMSQCVFAYNRLPYGHHDDGLLAHWRTYTSKPVRGPAQPDYEMGTPNPITTRYATLGPLLH
jgi:hypothetical protein